MAAARDEVFAARGQCDGKCTAGKATLTLKRALKAANLKNSSLAQLATQGRFALEASNKRVSELEGNVRDLKKAKTNAKAAARKYQEKLASAPVSASLQLQEELAKCKALARKLTEQVAEARGTVDVLKLATIHDASRHERSIERQKQSKARAIARMQAIVANSRAQVDDLKSSIDRVEANAAEARAAAETQAAIIDKLKSKTVKLSNRSKNRGRLLKAVRGTRDKLKAGAINKFSFLKCPVRKDTVKRRAMIERRKKAEEKIAEAISFIAGKYNLILEGCGAIELMPPAAPHEPHPSPPLVVKFKKGTNASNLVGKFLYLCDSGQSKKRHHENRMLCPTAVPSTYAVKKKQKDIEVEINKHVDWEATEDTFLVFPKRLLAWLIKHRGLQGHDVLHLLLEGDGRGTGRSFKSIIFQFRLLNEGRTMFREDRQYLLAMMKGDEDYDLLKRCLKTMLKALEKLQETGLEVDGKHYDVQLHSTGDAKWQKILHGMVNFNLNDHNCLFCFCHAEDRDQLDVMWETETDRFSGPLGEWGRQKKDLLPFVPMKRRYLENMHLVFRFLHDKLIGHMFTDVINTESDKPGLGMKAIEDILRGAPFNLTKFKFYAAKSKDESADGAFTWATPKLEKCLLIGSSMEFKQLYKRNPGRGALLQAACRKFVQLWRRLQVWPGDGDPSLTAQKIWEQHSEFLDILTTSCEDVPGTDECVMEGLPLSIITPYAHMWCNHIGEQFEASKAYAKYFQKPLGEPEEGMETCGGEQKTWGGGLKFARSDAMERKNLAFFHSYFQTSSRRPKTVIKEAGLQELRRLFNPDKTCRHVYFCCWCAKGYVREAKCKHHESECKQSPPEKLVLGLGEEIMDIKA